MMHYHVIRDLCLFPQFPAQGGTGFAASGVVLEASKAGAAMMV